MNIINLLLACLPFGTSKPRPRQSTPKGSAARFFRPGTEGIELPDRTVLSSMFRYPLDPGVSQASVTYFDDNSTAGQVRDWNGTTGTAAHTYDGHQGTDFAVPYGSKVYAAAAGTVVGVENSKLDQSTYPVLDPGNYVKIYHPDQGVYSEYFHLAKGSVKVVVGQAVSIGQEIGAVGLSGDTTGYHLHFETRYSPGTQAYAFDPFKGSGNSNTDSWWLDQGSYGGKPGIGSAGPANNNFSNRLSINSSGGTATGSNTGATQESGEPNPAGVSGTHSVWWSWQAPAAGTATISTAGSSFDTTLGVYVGSAVSSLTRIADNDDANGTLQSRVSFAAIAGTIYQIEVNGYGSSTGNITLSVSMSAASTAPTAPSNVAASALSSTQVSVSWQDNSNNEQGFRIYRWTGSWTQVGTVGANIRSFTDNYLQPSTTYYYTVTAYNSAGETWASSYATVTTLANVSPPAAASNLVWRTTSTTSGHLTWADNSNNESGFRIQYWSGSSWVTFETDAPNVTSSLTYSLQRGYYYYFRVVAYNSAGETPSGYIAVLM